MKNNDVIVIGGGLSGLFAAAVAASQNKKVKLLSYGAGALNIGGGIIDVLGYDNRGSVLESPLAGLDSLSAEHPYHKIGRQHIGDALACFQQITQAEGYSYIGSPDNMLWLPTAAGTLKPTCLAPKTMNPEFLEQAQNVYVVGFDYLKDFYPQLVAKNLQQHFGSDKKFVAHMCNLNFSEGRDITALDVARWLDTAIGQDSLVKQLTGKIEPGSTMIVPPVLGTAPDYAVMDKLAAALNCRFIEAVGLPPAVAGLRLRTMLLNHLKKLGVYVVEKALVTTSDIVNGQCSAVYTQNFDRKRSYKAAAYILANGGLYGGGLHAEPGRIIEPVFDLPIAVPAEQQDWANEQLFSGEKHVFAQLGVAVDDAMRPIDAQGNVVLSNVRVAGRNLRGYDFCFEKSGNGVALASAYKAAMSL